MLEWVVSLIHSLLGSTEENPPDPAAGHGPVMIPGG